MINWRTINWLNEILIKNFKKKVQTMIKFYFLIFCFKLIIYVYIWSTYKLNWWKKLYLKKKLKRYVLKVLEVSVSVENIKFDNFNLICILIVNCLVKNLKFYNKNHSNINFYHYYHFKIAWFFKYTILYQLLMLYMVQEILKFIQFLSRFKRYIF